MKQSVTRRAGRRGEDGYVAMLVAVLIPALFLGLAATALDTARWYLEIERVQKAADAAALAGVPYLPQDLPALSQARARALEVAKRNGYDDATADVEIAVAAAARPSQLRVTISSRIDNRFGAMIGIDGTTITRTAVADFTGPAPMGSPCNTFGNEPDSGLGSQNPPSGNGSVAGEGGAKNWSNGVGSATTGADCPRVPQFWGAVEGPESGKLQGDRYGTLKCENSSTDFCSGSGSGGDNDEFREAGYFFVVRVSDQMVGQEVRLQLYDPAMVPGGGQQCESLPNDDQLSDNMNPYVGTDATLRYADPESQNTTTRRSQSYGYCTGDSFPGGLGGERQMTTTFAVRQQVDSLDPAKAPMQNDTAGRPCVRQFTGVTLSGSPRGKNQLTRTSSAYNDQLARVFRNWVQFCSFRPARSGDYYVQVRTNVAAEGGSPYSQSSGLADIIYNGNATKAIAATGNTRQGAGANSFSMRAVVRPGYEKYVSVSGYGSMPILANAPSASSEFHLLRVLPGAAGQFISFEFFDAADATGAGTVTVLRPSDATGSITSRPFPTRCKTRKPASTSNWTLASNEVNCGFPVSNANNNGKVQEIQIPIPQDYGCNFNSPTGCWYKVQVAFSGSGVKVNDFTTWNAEIVGDPLRLIE